MKNDTTTVGFVWGITVQKGQSPTTEIMVKNIRLATARYWERFRVRASAIWVNECWHNITPNFVELAKDFGITGQKSVMLAVGLGVLFGTAFQLTEVYSWMSQWFTILIYGVLFGLMAAGLYRVTKNIAEK